MERGIKKMSDDKPNPQLVQSSSQFVNLADRTILRKKTFVLEYNLTGKSYAKPQKPNKIEDIELDTLGFVKEATVVLSFKREAVNPQTVKTVSGYFTRNVLIKIPKTRRFRYIYLTLSPCKSDDKLLDRKMLAIRDFLAGTTQELDFKQAKDLGFVVKWVSKAQRISKARFAELWRLDNYIGQRHETQTDRHVVEFEAD